MRPAAASAVLGLALAVGAPTAWVLNRPEAAAGIPVEQALPAPAPPAGAGALPAIPPVTTRDAAPAAAPTASAPTRISAPSLGVDAPVDAVGIAADGQMELPEDVSSVGWYRFGPVPGTAGSAVLAGHVDDRVQGPGALYPLKDAAVGDEVVVTDAAGALTRWRVVSREVITKQALPVERIFARDGAPRLTLITCGGPFLPEYRSYRDNVVVVAEPTP
ncbi:Sortase (surface protein transpeptidase) [Blastococcus aurantiacus]|uniref:Sortase (Surface protein transpeptidase) n=1 Tax=Blastococcus aurantiacus TaxID=1550231 RepID=A0A1G7N3R4_9ACTN|nr:class F sortase [Blastococcus aurantiacus]SDF68698.1 Sortase (surface protein transpeptidase) [Blastococcus aurantiacus]